MTSWHRRIKHSARFGLPHIHRNAVLDAQGWRCAYCPGRFFPESFITTDHVWPKRLRTHPEFREGLGNVLLVCLPCNQAKGGRAPHPCELIMLASINLRLAERGWLR